MSEQETCRTFVVPKLSAVGWDIRQIREQYRITNGRSSRPPLGIGTLHRDGEREALHQAIDDLGRHLFDVG